MSGRAGATAGDGRGGRGGRNRGGRGGGGRGGRGAKPRRSYYKSSVKELGDHTFRAGRMEDAAMFIKSKKALVNYLRMNGDLEATYVADSIENMALAGPPRPDRPVQIQDPAAGAAVGAMIDDEIEIMIWQGELKGYAKRRNNFVEGTKRAYATAWDMAEPALKSKIEQIGTYPQMLAGKNPVQLLEELRNVIFGREEHQQTVYSLVQLHKMLVLFYQQPGQTNEAYKEDFEALWEAYEQQGGNMWRQPGLIADRANDIAADNGRNAPDPADIAEAETWVESRFKASMMLSSSDNKRYESLKNYLENRYVMHHSDEYPENTTRLLSQMNNFRADRVGKSRDDKRRNEPTPDDDGVNFAQEGQDSPEEPAAEEKNQQGASFIQRGYTLQEKKSYADVAGTKPSGPSIRWKKEPQKHEDKAKNKAKEIKAAGALVAKPKTCMHCGGAHPLENCPDLTDEQLGQILCQIDIAEKQTDFVNQDREDGGMLQQSSGASSMLNPNYLYVDTCTTDDQMVNPTFLSKIHKVSKALRLHTNAGAASTNKRGYLGNTLFWLDRMGIANVVSLRTLEAKFWITYDSRKNDGAFILHTSGGDILVKRCPKTSFPYIDLTDEAGEAAIVLVQSVRKQYDGYTRKEVERAIEARKLQSRLGHPSEAQYTREVSRKPTPNALFDKCKVTAADITRARKIFGPSLPCQGPRGSARSPRSPRRRRLINAVRCTTYLLRPTTMWRALSIVAL